MKAKTVLLAVCGALIVATAAITFWPKPDRFPFLQGTARQLLEAHAIELSNHRAPQRFQVRTYALHSSRQLLNRRLTTELIDQGDWVFGKPWPSQGFSWTAKDGSAGLTLSRFPPQGLATKHRELVPRASFLVTYESKPASLIDQVKTWWRLHRP